MQSQQDSAFLQSFSLKQSKTGLFQFIGPSYQVISPDQDLQQCINLYPEVDQTGAGKNRGMLVGTPGITQFSNLPSNPVRQVFSGENRLFVVAGPNLFEIFADGSYENRSALPGGQQLVNDENPCYLAANGTGSQLCIAASYPSSTVNYNDIAINGSNDLEISSAGHPFTALANAGQSIVITGGSGFTPGTYTIQYVDGNGNAFLSASPGAAGSTGGQGSITTGPGGYLYCDEGYGPVQQRFTVDYTDLKVDGTNPDIVTSAAQPFSAATDDGFTLKITGGTGFNPGTYTIMSVDSLGNATLSGAAGSVGSTGGTGIEYLSYVPAVQLAYLDTFFVVQAALTSRLWYISNSDDGTSWDATQVASKESYPDNINAMIADHEELWFFGSEESIEGWHNSGAAPFPFVRDDNAAMHFGTEAPFSPQRFMLGFAWLAKDQKRGGRICLYAQGFQPVRISDHGVESIWNTYSEVSDCIAYSYEEDGHPFYVLNFASANATWVYDGMTQQWHQRCWWNGIQNVRQRQAFHAYVNIGNGDQHFVGDWQTGQIYVQSLTTYTDNGTEIQRIRTAPHISDEQTLNFYHRFQLDLQTGSADMNHIFLDWSDDGGHTFGQYTGADPAPPGQTPSMGNPATGEYGFRVIWTPLGSSRDRIFRVTISDSVPIAIVNAYLDCSPGYV